MKVGIYFCKRFTGDDGELRILKDDVTRSRPQIDFVLFLKEVNDANFAIKWLNEHKIDWAKTDKLHCYEIPEDQVAYMCMVATGTFPN